MRAIRLSPALALTLFVAGCATTGDQKPNFSGAGATLPAPLYWKESQEYARETKILLEYYPINSWAGIKKIQDGEVAFGSTDAPLSPEQLSEKGLVQFPFICAGIVVVVNLPHIASGDLVLDGETLAAIFSGEITNWSDEGIVALNPTLTLPNAEIAVVTRSGGSGTTLGFTKYLSDSSKSWKTRFGSAAWIEWPVGISAKESQALVSIVQTTDGSIGYVSYTYAQQSGLTLVSLLSEYGAPVRPTLQAFEAAAPKACWSDVGGFDVASTTGDGEQAWPITIPSYVIMKKEPADKRAALEALYFFDWTFGHEGQFIAKGLGFVPPPEQVVTAVERKWRAEFRINFGLEKE